MKMVEKVELVEKKVAKYIAFDGTEFSSRSDCIAYEERKNKENLSQIEQCEEAKGNPNFDGCEHMEYNDYFWFRPKNAEEIELLKKAYSADDYGIDNADIGKWICVEVCNDSVWFSRLDEGINYVRELLSRLGYEMTVTEK